MNFLLEQETKIAKLHFLYFLNQTSSFVTFGFQKIDNDYFIQCKRNQSGDFKGFIEWLQQANQMLFAFRKLKQPKIKFC
jgi:hypothetical protein